jgi:catechol 2,3-dioxygenase-like lactoylglutathione lyase family enzyme
MYDHIGLRVKDLEASARLYEALLAPLAHVLCSKDASGAGFGPRGAPALWLIPDQKGGGAHIAFRADSRAAVNAFYQAGLGAGARDNGAPGLRPDYGANYYAAFLIDLDGNNLEAVCFV